MHIDFMICICYNASRQKRYDYVPCEQRTSPGCTANTFEGSSLFISVVEHPPGYLLSLLCLSNHLQMRWQVTPAATVTKKDMTISICSPPPVAGSQSVIFCGQFIHAILFCSLLLRLLSFDFSLRIFLAQAGQYLDAPEPGTYSTPHTVQFLAGIAAHRFVGMICNSSTKPMNL